MPPDLTGFRRHYQQLIRRGRHADAGLLMAIGTGALWPKARLAENYPGTSDQCPMCNEYRQSEWHMFWGCPCLKDSGQEIITKTNALIVQAKPGIIDTKCYWLRGITPSYWTTPKIPPTYSTVPLGQGTLVETPCVDVYLDGSGSMFSRDLL